MRNPKKDARKIFDAAVAAADPGTCVLRHLKSIESPAEEYTVVGAGKAVVPMAEAVESWGPRVEGVVVTKYGHGGDLKRIRVLEAGHPVPDEAGVAATREILSALGERPVLFLLSGGASALLTAPGEGVTLEGKRRVTEILLRGGASIEELNCVRKHLSAVKGGRLAGAAHSPVLGLILSDVVGDPLDGIGSGPTAPDPTTVEDARLFAETYGVPEELRTFRETPKPGDPSFDRVENVIVGGNRLALEGARAAAERLGYDVAILTDELQGEAREVGRELVRRARAESGLACLLAGGETTVTVRGSGTGGRNQELALAAAMAIEGEKGITLLSAGTDGTDGPTDAAGAVVDGDSLADDAGYHLDANDAHTYFRKYGGLVVTGPTRTNVMDVVVILKTP